MFTRNVKQGGKIEKFERKKKAKSMRHTLDVRESEMFMEWLMRKEKEKKFIVP